MPTADRAAFVPLALRSFLLQEHVPRELIVMDDGHLPVAALIPDPDTLADGVDVRYLRLRPGLSLGAKRNAACERARGSLIAHWDDDDWIAPSRLRRQVEALQGSGADVCGLSELYFADPVKRAAWLYRYPAGSRSWVAGGTLLYRKANWAKQPFPDIDRGEDTRFVWAREADEIHAMQPPDWYVARVHGGNTSPKRTQTSRWHPCSIEDVEAVLGIDAPLFFGRPCGKQVVSEK